MRVGGGGKKVKVGVRLSLTTVEVAVVHSTLSKSNFPLTQSGSPL